MGQEEFIRSLTETLPPRPPNIDRIVELNRAGGGEPTEVPTVDAGEARDLLRAGVTVLDGRAPPEFDAGHLAGALNLPLAAPGVGTRAGWSLAPDETVVIAADHPDAARAMASALHAVGLWQASRVHRRRRLGVGATGAPDRRGSLLEPRAARRRPSSRDGRPGRRQGHLANGSRDTSRDPITFPSAVCAMGVPSSYPVVGEPQRWRAPPGCARHSRPASSGVPDVPTSCGSPAAE